MTFSWFSSSEMKRYFSLNLVLFFQATVILTVKSVISKAVLLVLHLDYTKFVRIIIGTKKGCKKKQVLKKIKKNADKKFAIFSQAYQAATPIITGG